MKLNFEDSEGDEIVDPMELMPDSVQKIIIRKLHELGVNLGRRQKFYMESHIEQDEKTDLTNEDASSLALVERLALYETMMDAMMTRMDSLEARLGGKYNETDKN
tara:strand:+ start:884 stop:1198 length:315 start_codon:yes stop_codon:yes gene_type:complete